MNNRKESEEANWLSGMEPVGCLRDQNLRGPGCMLGGGVVGEDWGWGPKKGSRSGLENQTVAWWWDDLEDLVYLIRIIKVGGGDWETDRLSEQGEVFKEEFVNPYLPISRGVWIPLGWWGEVIVEMTSNAPLGLKFLWLQLAVVQWDIFESTLKKGKYCIEVIVYAL